MARSTEQQRLFEKFVEALEKYKNKTVTIRDRDSMAQSRIDISDIPSFVESKIKS